MVSLVLGWEAVPLAWLAGSPPMGDREKAPWDSIMLNGCTPQAYNFHQKTSPCEPKLLPMPSL
eukprot:1552645-Amphidinium_carterae.1